MPADQTATPRAARALQSPAPHPTGAPVGRPHLPQPQGEAWTVRRILDWTTDHLTKHGSESPRLDAEILLAHARGCKRIELYTRYDEVLGEPQRAAMRGLVKRRASAEPVAYLVGHKEFYSLPFRVNNAVLIPRPETESLVLEAVELAKPRPEPRLTLLDLCTGSGCVGIAAAKNHARFAVTATDLSDDALAVARDNAVRLGVSDRVAFAAGDLFAALPADATFDFILSNPPYVADAEFETLLPDIRLHEPSAALLAGPDGMDFLRRIAAEASERLNPGGHLLVELDPDQADRFADLLRPRFAAVRLIKDLSGRFRVVHASL